MMMNCRGLCVSNNTNTNIISKPEVITSRSHSGIPADNLGYSNSLLGCNGGTTGSSAHQVEFVTVSNHTGLYGSRRGNAIAAGGSSSFQGSGGWCARRIPNHIDTDIVSQPKTGAATTDSGVPTVKVGDRNFGTRCNTSTSITRADQVELITVKDHATLDRAWCGDTIAWGCCVATQGVVEVI